MKDLEKEWGKAREEPREQDCWGPRGKEAL